MANSTISLSFESVNLGLENVKFPAFSLLFWGAKFLYFLIFFLPFSLFSLRSVDPVKCKSGGLYLKTTTMTVPERYSLRSIACRSRDSSSSCCSTSLLSSSECLFSISRRVSSRSVRRSSSNWSRSAATCSWWVVSSSTILWWRRCSYSCLSCSRSAWRSSSRVCKRKRVSV